MPQLSPGLSSNSGDASLDSDHEVPELKIVTELAASNACGLGRALTQWQKGAIAR